MKPWWQGRMVGLDFETTAPNPEEARIVTAAVVSVGAGEEPVTRTWLADPGVPIPDGAAAIHGITTERAAAEGEPLATVIPQLLEVLAEETQTWGDAPIVAFNARYDVTVLDRECRRLNLGQYLPPRVVDPFVLDKQLTPFRRGSRKLGVVCELYGIELGDDAHDAGADALAACRLAWKLAAHGQIDRRVRNSTDGAAKKRLVEEWASIKDDIDRLHAAQVRWAADQAEGLSDYFRRQGRAEDAMGVRGEWPLIPVETTG